MPGTSPNGPTISVVMPAYNCEHNLDRVLPPLVAAREADLVQELIAVDDSSVDGTVERFRAAGFQVIASGGRLGPGACRNRGVDSATGEVIVFVDSDVVVHSDTIAKFSQLFSGDPDCVAAFGSYDDRPAAPGLVSQYRNLLHHYVHQSAPGEARTFWAGCGAVRRDTFLAVGGFDAERYPRPSIEDIELGYRIRAAGGRILLVPDIQCTHLKRWTLAGMIMTDIFRRALPWARLTLAGEGGSGGELNLRAAERLRAAIAGLFWLAIPIALWRTALFWLPLAFVVAAWASNYSFFALVYRGRGLAQLVAAVVLHQVYYLYSVLTYVYCRAERLVRR